MDFSIYVLGDVSTFYSTINAVTMIFRAGGFMTGVYLVGGFIALMSGIMFMIQKSGGEQFIPANGPIGGLFGFGMVVACCSIQTSVTIEDIYTGNIAKVDHVPLIIAAPASLFTTASYSVFDRINTAFQSTSGSYMAVSQTGFITPMKLLMTLRKGVENVDPFLVASLKQFMIDCVPGSTTFNMNDFQASPDMVNYALSFARPNGLTTYWDNLNSLGKSMACQDASAKINTAVSAFPASANLKKLVNAGMKDKNPMGGAYTQVNVSEAITNLVPTMWSAAQSSDQFMTNALFFNSVWGTYNCLDSVQDQNSFNLCMVSLTQQDEQFRSDAVASGSFFAKLMMPTMIFLQLLFFGFAPIVIIYGLFKGAGALMAYVKYLGFGVWTSSWLPFSAVIQMYIQNDVADKMAQFTEKGLVPSNLQAVYYDVLATRLGIASDMLAATPLISAAMLGVTGYGMVSLASRWSGRDHNDEKLQSPDILKNGAHVDVASRNQYSSENAGAARAGLIKAGSNWNTADLKETLGQSKSSALGEDHTKRSESSQAVEASLRQVMSYKQGDTWSNQEMQSLERAHTSMTQQSMKMADKLADSLGLTGSKRDSFKQNFNAEVGFSGIFGGVKTGIASATGKEMSADQATKINSEFGTEIAKNESDMKGWKAAASSAFAHSSGKEAATENSLGRRLSSTTADTQSSFQRFQQATTAEASVSAGVKINEETSGANLISSPQAMHALNSAISNLDSSQREDFNKKFPALETRYEQNSVGMQGKREAAQLWALRTVDSSAFANVISAMQSGSISGPTDTNAGRFQGVGSRAQQVSDNPGGNVANANVGRPSLDVPGVSADQVGPTGAPEQKTLKGLVKGLDPSGDQQLRDTFINSQMSGGVLNGQDKIRTARHKVENGDTSISVKDMTDTMSAKPITNAVSAVGNKEQQWEEENPKTAMAVNVGAALVPIAGWGGAAAQGARLAHAGMTSYKAAQGLKVAESGIEVAQAARVANAAGHEIPAVLRGPGQASRVVNAEHVKEASETATAAGKALSSAGRDAQKATKLAAKTSVEPAMFFTAKNMADSDQTQAGVDAGADAPLNPGSAVHSMRQASNEAPSQRPMMMPMPPAADPLAALGGHSGNLTSMEGNAPQQFGPISANPPAAHTASPAAPERGNAGQTTAGSAKAQPQAAAPTKPNAAPLNPGAAMHAPHGRNAENATPAGNEEAPAQATAPNNANAGAEAPSNPGSTTLSMRQDTNQDQSQQPLMMPMAPASDPLAALGGHPGNLKDVGETAPQPTGPTSANQTPAAPTASPVPPQRGNAGKATAGSGKAQPQPHAPISANAAPLNPGAAMHSPHGRNAENAMPTANAEAQPQAIALNNANADAEAPLNPGSAALSMRQDTNQDQSQQPLMMPMASATDPLAAPGGHSDESSAVGGGETPLSANPAPAAHTAPPVAPQRGNARKLAKAGGGKAQPQATAPITANAAVAAGAVMHSPHPDNAENATPAGNGEQQLQATGPISANADAEAPLNPDSPMLSMRQDTNQDQSQQPLMMPMAPATDPLAAPAGHSGNLSGVGGNEPQQFAPASTNPAPAAHTAPLAPQRGNAGKSIAGSGKAQPKGNAPINANAAVAAVAPLNPGAVMHSPLPGNAENATSAGSGEEQLQAIGSANTEAEAPLNPGAAMLSMRQDTNQDQSQQPLVMPTAPAADLLAAPGGQSGDLIAMGGSEAQQFGPISANQAPVVAPAQPMAQHGNLNAAGSGEIQLQGPVLSTANAPTMLPAMDVALGYENGHQPAESFSAQAGHLAPDLLSAGAGPAVIGSPLTGHSDLQTEFNQGDLSANLTATGGVDEHQAPVTIGSGNAMAMMNEPLLQESNHGLGGFETNQPGLTANLTTVGGGNDNTYGDGLMGSTAADSEPLFASNEGQRPAPRVIYNPTPNESSGSTTTPAPGGRGGDTKDSGPGVRGSA